MAAKLRIFAEDFPTPTAVTVPWPEAGVVLFVDVCRSQFETAPPLVWLMQPSAVAQHPTAVTSLPVSPSSAAFRCTSVFAAVVNDTLLLVIGDALTSNALVAATAKAAGAGAREASSIGGAAAAPSAASSHSPPTSATAPFFGVCASLLPPAHYVREYGVDAFATFAFAWLNGPDHHSMRPAARVGFACCVTPHCPAATAQALAHAAIVKQQQPNTAAAVAPVTPAVSVWVHGGLPYVPRKSMGGGYHHEPLVLRPAGGAPSGTAQQQQQQQQQQRHSPRNGGSSEDWPFSAADRTGGGGGSVDGGRASSSGGAAAIVDDAPDIFVLGGSSTAALTLSPLQRQQQQLHDEKYLRRAVAEDFFGLFELRLSVGGGGGGDPAAASSGDSVSVWPWVRHASLPLLTRHAMSYVVTGTPNANAGQQPPQTQQQRAQQQRVYLVAHGGLRLHAWRCARADLLPPLATTEFAVSDATYVFDVAADAWEWRDALADAAGEVGAAYEGVMSAEPPTEFDEATLGAEATSPGGGGPATNFGGGGGGSGGGARAVVRVAGPRPPPVFGHRIAAVFSGAAATTFAPHVAAASRYAGGGGAGVVARDPLSLVLCGGLRGRFSERSGEMWCVAPAVAHPGFAAAGAAPDVRLECSQLTGPPCAATHVFGLTTSAASDFFLEDDAGNSHDNDNGSGGAAGGDGSDAERRARALTTARLWAVDLRSKRMWFRAAGDAVALGASPWEGPVLIVDGRDRGRSIDLDNLPPTVVAMPNPQTVTAAAAAAASGFGTPSRAVLLRLGGDDHDDDDDAEAEAASAAGADAIGGGGGAAPSPGTAAFVVDAFEFG
jgi:hypothetical protein